MENRNLYHIPDEPLPSPWNHLVVNPIWPLLAVMLAGSWLAFPWFAFNSFAIGAHNRFKTLGVSLTALAGNVVVFLGIVFVLTMLGMPEEFKPYLKIPYILWKLGMAYVLFVMQSPPFEVYKYLENPVRNGLFIVIAGLLVSPKLVIPLIKSPFWVLLVG